MEEEKKSHILQQPNQKQSLFSIRTEKNAKLKMSLNYVIVPPHPDLEEPHPNLEQPQVPVHSDTDNNIVCSCCLSVILRIVRIILLRLVIAFVVLVVVHFFSFIWNCFHERNQNGTYDGRNQNEGIVFGKIAARVVPSYKLFKLKLKGWKGNSEWSKTIILPHNSYLS